MRTTPEILEVDDKHLEDVLCRVEQTLDAKDAELLRALAQSYRYVTGLVEDKNISLRRLRQLLFGAGTEKTAAVLGRMTDRSDATAPPDSQVDTTPVDRAPVDANDEEAAPGHGRHGVDAYAGAERIAVSHPTLSAGDACRQCPQADDDTDHRSLIPRRSERARGAYGRGGRAPASR